MVDIDGEGKKQRNLSRLLEAAKIGDLIALNECLDKGADIFETDKFKASVLHFAAENGSI